MRKKRIEERGGKWATLRHCKIFSLLIQLATKTVPNSSQEIPQAFQNIHCFPTVLNALGVTPVIRLAPCKRRAYD